MRRRPNAIVALAGPGRRRPFVPLALRVALLCPLLAGPTQSPGQDTNESAESAESSRADDAAHDAAHYLTDRPDNATSATGLLPAPLEEFSPARAERWTQPFVLDAAARVTLTLSSADGDTVATLLDDIALDAGRHEATWDGRDSSGTIAPDEAWVPRLEMDHADGRRIVDDPSRYSGGEIIENLAWNVRGRHLDWRLPQPSRVLVRIGIEDGPVVRAPYHWRAVASGRSVLRWDGYDAAGVDHLADRDDLWQVVMAYRLPRFAVITTGNRSLDYRAWRAQRGWPEPSVALEGIPLQRRGQRLSRDHFLPRSYLPRVHLALDGPAAPGRAGLPIVDDELALRVSVPAEDRWILDSSFYEVGFYLDYRFDSEEEQGFMPMRKLIDTTALTPGRHVATVQLFGYGGFISSWSVEFERSTGTDDTPSPERD